MTRTIALAAALLGLSLLLAPIAEAGGERRGISSRGGSSAVRSRSSVRRTAPPRVAPSRSHSSRAFARPSRAPTFRSRSQPSFRQRVPSSSSQSRSRRMTSSGSRGLVAPRRTPSVTRPRTTRPTTAPTWNRSSRSWSSSSPSASRLRSSAQRARNDAAMQRLRQRSTSVRSNRTPSAVSSRGRTASSRGDSRVSALRERSRLRGRSTNTATAVRPRGNTSVRTPTTFGRNTRGTRATTRQPSSSADLLRRGSFSRNRLNGSRFGTRSGRTVTSPRSTLGRSRASGLVSSRVGTRAATGGSVRTRVGTRSGRVGRSYRIRHHHHGHRHYHRHHHRHGPVFGFYYAWHPYHVPYYRVYPRYGLYFGYGISYYGPTYSTVFVDAVDYVPTEVIVREEVIEEVIEEVPAPAPAAKAPVEEQAFPEPAPLPEPEKQPDDEGQRAPHPDFEPAVKDFLAGRYQQTLERLDRVLTAEPDNGEAWLAAMHANFALGRYGRAGNALAKAAELDAFPRGYRFDPRPLYQQTGNYERAVKALDAHIAKNPQDADALLVRAYLHVALGERKEAQDLLQTVLELRPADETAPALALALLPPPPPPKDAVK